MWEYEYRGDSKAIVTAPHPRKPGMRFTLAVIEDFSPEATKANAALIASAPDLAARVEELEAALAQTLDALGPDRTPTDRQAAALRARALLREKEGGK